jgi:dCTP diphosphatase
LVRVREELADVLYAVRLADVLGIELSLAIQDKVDANAKRYRIEDARGNARKYSGRTT